MPETVTRPTQAVAPLTAISAVVVLVVLGLNRGIWLPNLHNGLLALAFTFVGAYILYQRPGHREGGLFLSTGVVEAVMFFGRQHGHAPASQLDTWWGWLGVWPLALALALTTLSILCFPNGRLPSPRWRWIAGGVVVLAVLCSTASALWPVEYSSAQVVMPHPFSGAAPEVIATAWSAVAHPAYALFQLLWVVAIILRWRISGGETRRQLAWLAAVAALSATALLVGLAVGGTPVPGLLSATLLPLAAGWVIVHGEHATAYAALSWLSREPHPDELPMGMARAAAGALAAREARVWMGNDRRLECVGAWPADSDPRTPITLAKLESGGLARAVRRDGEVVGAISIERLTDEALSTLERRLFDDLAAQAALVVAHLRLARLVDHGVVGGQLHTLTRRERQVLDLMAIGLSNAAICERLHLSIKTVEPAVGSIFAKLGLSADANTNRRVLAVLIYLQR